MSLTLREESTGTKYEPIEAGTYPARVYQLIDLGTQVSTFEGEEKSARKVMIGFEICDPDMRREDGEPYLVKKRFTGSLHPKAALRKFLAAMRGRDFTAEELTGFELVNILKAPCLLNLTNDTKGDRTYTNISSVVKLPKGYACEDLSQDAVSFDLDKPDWSVFATFHSKLQDVIMAAPEFPRDKMPGKVVMSAPAPAPAPAAKPAAKARKEAPQVVDVSNFEAESDDSDIPF
jgi:hypothetical protein